MADGGRDGVPSGNLTAVRVVIGEDHALMREGLRLVLERAGFEIAGVADDAPALLRRVRTLRPDLVIADICMPPDFTDDGLRAVLTLRAERPDLPVMVLSQHVQREYASELLESGEDGVGYVLKQRVGDVDAFIDDVRRIQAGATVLDPVVIATLMDRPRADDHGLRGLTARQRQVLALMAEGRSNAAIAERLAITEKAVTRHASHIYASLGITESADDHRRVLAVVRHLST
jgi:DNA-binding NarL/FixJ family response regulator